MVPQSSSWLRLNRPSGKSFFKLYYTSGTTGLNEKPINNDLKIFPNPAQNQLIVEQSEISKNGYFTIFNTDGQELIKKQIVGLNTQIDISTLVFRNVFSEYGF